MKGRREAIHDPLMPPLAAPVFPGTSSEFITLIAHFHRAEIARMAGWRDRIDRTTNWAITVVAAMLSLSLSTPTAHHGVLLFSMVLVLLLLVIEARRYRFFDVYRARVRRIERNYFAQVFAPEAETTADWLHVLGEDLRKPVFLVSLQEAMSRRLRRNYCWMFMILLVAWLLKTIVTNLPTGNVEPHLVASLAEWNRNAALGPVPGFVVIAGVLIFYGWILFVSVRQPTARGELAHGNVHV